MSGYFHFLHHPHEEIGVDFWWIDWQHGDKYVRTVRSLLVFWAALTCFFLIIFFKNKKQVIYRRIGSYGTKKPTHCTRHLAHSALTHPLHTFLLPLFFCSGGWITCIIKIYHVTPVNAPSSCMRHLCSLSTTTPCPRTLPSLAPFLPFTPVTFPCGQFFFCIFHTGLVGAVLVTIVTRSVLVVTPMCHGDPFSYSPSSLQLLQTFALIIGHMTLE